MTTVYVDPNEPFESALRRFNKKVQDSRILIEVKERQAFKKPSDARRAEKAASKSRALKRKRKMDRVLEFQSMHKFPLRNRSNHRPQNGQRPNNYNNRNNNSSPSSSNTNNYSQNTQDRRPPQAPSQRPRADQPSSESLKSLQDKFSKGQ